MHYRASAFTEPKKESCIPHLLYKICLNIVSNTGICITLQGQMNYYFEKKTALSYYLRKISECCRGTSSNAILCWLKYFDTFRTAASD